MPVNGGKYKDNKYQVESWVFITSNAPGEFFFCSTPLLITSGFVQDKCGCVLISHFLTHFPVDVHPYHLNLPIIIIAFRTLLAFSF